jgi:soluble lytic murein transglycosylase-like protein
LRRVLETPKNAAALKGGTTKPAAKSRSPYGFRFLILRVILAGISLMPPPPALVALARAAAAAHKLDPALVCAVVEQESSWNPWAVRYEHAFLARYVEPLYNAGKISITEAYTRSISWGLMQLMGEVARELGCLTPSLAELCDPATGLEFGCRQLRAKFDGAGGDATRALLAWNGGANHDYPAEVLARVAHYK